MGSRAKTARLMATCSQYHDATQTRLMEFYFSTEIEELLCYIYI